MILDVLSNEDMTPRKAAKLLVWMYGAKAGDMEPAQWGAVVVVSEINQDDVRAIGVHVRGQVQRVKQFLKLS